MLHFKRPLPLFLLLAPLAACGTSNRGLESVHQPVVQRSDYAIDVATQSGALAPGEAQRLGGWMEAMRLGYGDVVALDDPNGTGRGAHDDVQAVAARYGLLVGAAAPVTNGPIAPGTVRIVVSRTRAIVPGCPDHSRMNDPNFNAHTASNYGCASNTNLAAMVANPADLVRGQPGALAYEGRTGTRAIGMLRAATPTGEGGGWLKGKAESAGGK
ncbi:pilus assembly protein CpaD [Sphingomonas sp. Leaf412]|uniref:CpaD family pilus assembly lipoprotein n=1 Tax=Sphingomonas sp. Leaf412 TaxID=1736370 RepID=UPI0006F7D2E4|nr:CpaD family pilus assembly lipoprotein [Sphingomonas sp. Leaf412]KQT31725.1 pilus assembly protein CpaD [Sphingomonas sp. Leaf412]